MSDASPSLCPPEGRAHVRRPIGAGRSIAPSLRECSSIRSANEPARRTDRRSDTRWDSSLTDILVPDPRLRLDESLEHLHAISRVQINHIHRTLPQPVDSSSEVARFAYHHCTDLELGDQTAAVPAGSERRYH